jgi:Family of unknown function (DUF6519)
MKADLSRTTFHPLKHFTRVMMQQGRVQLDADWNEQAAILLHYVQALAADLIGPHGGPEDNFGYEISLLSVTVTDDFRISLGHYYVDGILCEADSTPIAIFPAPNADVAGTFQSDTWILDGAPLDSYSYAEVFDDSVNPAFTPTLVQITTDAKQRTVNFTVPAGFPSAKNPKLRRVLTYLTQPDVPLPLQLNPGTTYQVYLDVWERHVTYIEDDSIREVALGGPDTATRAKLICQVMVTPTQPGADNEGPCLSVDQLQAMFQWPNRGQLKATAALAAASSDPCIIPPDSRYRGPENQLYRVEIHRSGAAWDRSDPAKSTAATFKWSRENGSVVFAIASPITTSGGITTVVLESLGRDDRFGLTEGDWVEVQDDKTALMNMVGNLLQVQSIDRSAMTVTLNGVPGVAAGADVSLHPLLRRWDESQGDPAEGGLTLGSDGAALIVEDSNGLWLSLEDGVQVQFQKPDAGQMANQYRTGDYWLIPARTATGDVEWPSEVGANGNLVRVAKPPDGVIHHYAPLAVVTPNGAAPTSCANKFANLVAVEQDLNI